MADNRPGPNNRQIRRGGINATFIGCVVLGICILIAGLNIGGNIKKFNKSMSEIQFASTNSLSAPSELSFSEKKYLTQDEAAEYLNISGDKLLSLISGGDISEYIKTETGYSISVSVLDEWFDNEAYQTKLNSAGTTADTDE